jgi:MoaA/NifB/PqqE/SkfB family radical SAM enzyme
MEIPLYHAYRMLGAPVLPPAQMTLALTHRCDNRCATCRAHTRDTAASELSADDYEQLFSNMKFHPFAVTLTGGEPLMRGDFLKIAATLCRTARPAFLFIETCGDRPDRLYRAARLLTERHPDTHLAVLLSMQDIQTGLARRRGDSRNSFELFMKSYRALRGISALNLTVGVNVVVSRDNADDAAAIIDHAFLMYPDVVKFSVAYGSGELAVSASETAPLRKEHTTLMARYLEASRRRGGRAPQRFLWHVFRRQARLASNNLHLMTQTTPCQAAHGGIYVTPSGLVLDCPVAAREAGDLRACGMDLERLLSAAHAANARKQVKTSGCFCPMEYCDIIHTMISPADYARVIARSL